MLTFKIKAIVDDPEGASNADRNLVRTGTFFFKSVKDAILATPKRAHKLCGFTSGSLCFGYSYPHAFSLFQLVPGNDGEPEEKEIFEWDSARFPVPMNERGWDTVSWEDRTDQFVKKLVKRMKTKKKGK